jgi:hypothetical protein
MKRQGYNARLDDSMGSRNGKKKQAMASRRKESKGTEMAMGKPAYSGDTMMMMYGGSPKKMKKGGKLSSRGAGCEIRG